MNDNLLRKSPPPPPNKLCHFNIEIEHVKIATTTRGVLTREMLTLLHANNNDTDQPAESDQPF